MKQTLSPTMRERFRNVPAIGHKRRDYMELVMEPAQLDVMRRIKAALDPNQILNPAKIFSM